MIFKFTSISAFLVFLLYFAVLFTCLFTCISDSDDNSRKKCQERISFEKVTRLIVYHPYYVIFSSSVIQEVKNILLESFETFPK